ncbi:hypothetical protein HPP92_014473 [Vanilla planifolia]|uniref:Uncharacterized protein n=1 Tax=Vanilla planifolia TaxID=51239 RepID=A0A835UUS9_VANPL|nr:hypothetical protein HPP92_014473 [Vanilla planifolia]
MENPFSLKVGQVFTGFGVGCGIGIGVGRPIYFGAIPALQSVLSATRGATDALSGASRHFNSSLRKVGIKRIEAGIGCGIGMGHGFGVGIALKPGVVRQIQSYITDSILKNIMNMGLAPSITSAKNFLTGSIQSDKPTRNLKALFGGPMDLALESTQSTFQPFKQDGSIHSEAASIASVQRDSFQGTPLGTRTEKVIDNFYLSPILKSEAEANLDELARSLRAENNVLQLLLKHQELIEKLLDENKKLQKILTEELNVAPEKFQASTGINHGFTYYTCADCFECRRRGRKLRRFK